VWHRRATHAALPHREQAGLVLLDESRGGGAMILPDGTVLAGGEHADAFAADAIAILDRWLAAGRPPMSAWRVGFIPAGDPAAPILVPHTWKLPD
ncbi:MAG TPA: methyltransferase, partial [Actinoplanes sp.]